jgi:hypothetical protein
MAAADTTAVQKRSLARHHRLGGPVVTVLGRESPIRQPLSLQQVERIAASLVTDLPSLGEDHECEQDVVVPLARGVQLDERGVDQAAVSQPSIEPPAESVMVLSMA